MAEYDEQLWAEGGRFFVSSNEPDDVDYFFSPIHPQYFRYMNKQIYFNKSS